MRQVETFLPGEGQTSFSHRLYKNAGKVAAGAAAAQTIDYLNSLCRSQLCAREPKAYSRV